MEIHTDDDDKINDERVNDIINTKKEFKKRGKNDKGTKPYLVDTDADEASKSMNESERREKSKKLPPMKFKTNKAIRTATSVNRFSKATVSCGFTDIPITGVLYSMRGL